MKVDVLKHLNVKKLPFGCSNKLIILTQTSLFLTIVSVFMHSSNSPSLLLPPEVRFDGSVPLDQRARMSSLLQPPGISTKNSTNIRLQRKCDMFDNGNWVPHPSGPYYTNESECEIDDRQNCMKFGRPDTGFLKWRWKPDDCELPFFDAAHFLELVRGKSMAFVGDSLSRNHVQSLVCVLGAVANPVDVSYVQDARFRRWHYAPYNITLAILWSTHLVRSSDADPDGHMSLMNLYLDEVDEAWAAQIENYDYVIISVGQWFSIPSVYHEKGQVVGCHLCNNSNITDLSKYYGFRMAFRMAFRTLLSIPNYKGTTILRTITPAHFENGEWNSGGTCARTRPFTRREKKVDGYVLEFYLTQLEEFRAAKVEGRKRGLKFRLLDITEPMLMRPDGHPNHYGQSRRGNVAIADCVHWCLPGPIDTWNEFLFQILKTEGAKIK